MSEGITITFNAATEEAAAKINEFLDGIKEKLEGFAASVAAALGVAELNKFVGEAARAAQSVAMLEQSLRSNGQYSAEYVKELEEQREALSKVTNATVDVLIGVERTLIGFGVSREQMPKLTELSLDLAAAMGTDAKDAALQLGRALAGQDVAFRGFRLDIDKTLPRVEQINQAIAQLSARYGGQARAAFDAGATSLERFRKESEETEKALGSVVIADFITPFFSSLNERMGAITDKIKNFNRDFPELGAGIRTAAAALGSLFANFGPWVVSLITFSGAVKALTLSWAALGPIIATVKAALGYGAGVVGEIMGLASLSTAIKSWSDLKLLMAVTAGTNFAPILTALASTLALVALIIASVITLNAYLQKLNAEKGLAQSSINLTGTNAKLHEAILREIELRVKNHQMTEAEADAMKKKLAVAQATMATANEYGKVLGEAARQLNKDNKGIGSGPVADPTLKDYLRRLKMAEETLAHARLAGEAGAELGQNAADQEKLKADYESRLLSLQQYLEKRRALIIESRDTETNVKVDELDLLDKQIGLKQKEADQVPPNDPSAREHLSQLTALRVKREELLANIFEIHSRADRAIEAMDSESEKTAQALLETIRKKYEEATQSKLQQLKAEYEEQKRDAQRKLGESDDYYAALSLMDQAYAIKKRALLEAGADEENKIRLENIRTDREAAEKNPDLTDAEKKKIILPLLQRERDLLAEILHIEQERAKDPSRNEDQQDEARKKIAEVQRRIAENADKSQDMAKTPFDKNLQYLKDQWSDVSRSLTDGAFRTIQQGVSGMANALTSLIMGTKSAGAAFAEFGMSILTSFISMIIEALLWAYVAIPILTALGVLTGGATAAAGSAVTTAAVAGAISSVGSATRMAEGGMVSGPGSGTSDSIPAMLSHGEFVMPAARVRQFGSGFFESLRQGALNLRDIDSRVVAGLPQPYYSDPAYQQEAQRRAAQGAAGGAGNVNVEGHKMSVAFVSNRNEMREYLNSAEGEKHIVDISKRRRLDIGIGT